MNGKQIMSDNKQKKKFNLLHPIIVEGAREHNLKNITVSFPRNQFIVVTGVSGSGKSSLTIDTLFAEGQRRYMESLSAYIRQFMDRMDKPDVDNIKGLSPAIAIEQKVITRTPRSTVGSLTEIYDYLRLLFARIGKTISPVSGKEVKKDSVQDVLQFLYSLPHGSRVILLIPFKAYQNRSIKEELNILTQKGFSRIYLLQQTYSIEELLEKPQAALQQLFQKEAYVIVDRIIAKEFTEDEQHRLADSVSTAFYEGEGDVYVEVNQKDLKHFCNRFEEDNIVFEEPVPNLFSFNNPYGACPVCEGFGQVLGIDPNLVIPNKNLSVYEGAVAPWHGQKLGEWKKYFMKTASKYGFPIHKPVIDLTPEEEHLLWHGNNEVYGIESFFKEVEQNLYKVQYRVLLSRYRGKTICPECKGYRLRKEALYVQVHGKNIGELSNMQIKDLQQWFSSLSLSSFEQQIAKRILLEIEQRLQTMIDVGLGYLTLLRSANTLSGGESQRIQLTRSLGSNLTDSLYILDEPSIGLHARDTEQLIKVLQRLRDLNNTVIVVEHDAMMMQKADYIIDMGPLASHLGGEVVAQGNYEAILHNKKSLTGKYLRGELQLLPPANKRVPAEFITIHGARQHNLKNITVQFPLNVLCVVSGVSGSGKTTLVKQILYPALQKIKTGYSDETAGAFHSITGNINAIQKIELIDQNPIGKSSRSNPVTYVKAYDEIRSLFAEQPLAKIRGFQPKHFSFNVDGGRCDACKGEGEQIVEMQFLADVHLTCEVCHGKRFKEEVLEVTYKNNNIYDVLEMSVDEAIDFFHEHTTLIKLLQPLQDVGLGYIKLGQSSSTLSGGEAQRVKLASFLTKKWEQEKILFIFDEPTTGLHFHDIKKLLNAFQALLNQQHSLIVIEHNTDVIRYADWVIDLGPEAGDEGGYLIFEGKPEELKKIPESYTGKFL